MNNRVVRKYFYQLWRGYSTQSNTKREIVFLLLGAQRHTLGFGNLLRLMFIRINVVMNDDSIVSLFTDDEISQFVKFALVLPSGDTLYDLKLAQAVPIIGVDLSRLHVYLDVARIYHDVGVDLSSVGPDPMKAPEAFFLKLLWPGYIDCDEKYLAIIIAGILSTRSDQDRVISHLPPFSMHLTEVGMHLKMLEAVDASLAWALPNLKQEGLRLARFLARKDTARYFSVTASPYHHSDKVVSLNHEAIWEDAGKVWAVHDVSVYLSDLVHESTTDAMEIAEHLEFVTQSCAEAALDDQRTHHDFEHNDRFQSIAIENSTPSKFAIDPSKHELHPSRFPIDQSKRECNQSRFPIVRSTTSKGVNDGSTLTRGKISNDWRPFGRELNIGNKNASSKSQSLVTIDDPLIGSSKSTLLADGSTENGAGLAPADLDCDRENFNRLVM